MIHPEIQIGHIHLTVSDLKRALSFYQGVLGFEITNKIGDSAVFLSAGGYHHHIALNTWAGVGAKPAPDGHTGLYHFAILYPTRKELAKVFKRIIDTKYPVIGVADHGVSESIYVEDPDANGIELTWDKPKKLWQKRNGEIAMVTEPLDTTDLLSELEK